MRQILKIIEKNMKNLSKEEREEFRNTIQDTFYKIVLNLDKRIEKFEEKILDSVGNENEAEDISVLLLEEKKIHLYEDCFFPILEKEKQNLKDILLSDEKVLKDIYLPFDDKEMFNYEKQYYNANIKIDEKIFPIKLKLRKNNKYKEQTKLIYETFLLNNLNWKTILNPYGTKMFQLEIVEFDENVLKELNEDTDIKIEYLDSDIKDRLEENVVLCWNIEVKSIVAESVISPTKNNIHLESILAFNNNKHIYICPNNYKIYMTKKINDRYIFAVTEDIKNIVWKIIEIKEIGDRKRFSNLKYPLFENKANLHFINQLRTEKYKRIRTISELQRVANSFPVFTEYFEMENVSVVETFDNIETIEINDFIIDEFRMKGQEKILKIEMRIKRNNEFTKEILNFIISEIQLYFPEYRCVGVIV